MKTIMIKDEVYEKLSTYKENKSFSEVLEELVDESRSAKIKRLRKYFGGMSQKKAGEILSTSKKIRNEFVINA